MADMNATGFNSTSSVDIKYVPTLAELIFVGVNVFIFFAGSTINIITIITILKHDGKDLGIQNLLVLNFCVSNLLFCMIAGDTSRRMLTVPFYSIHLCVFRAFSLHVIMTGSVYSLLLVSFNRYFIILYPRSVLGFTSVKKTLITICLFWLVCFLIMLPPLTGLWGQLGFEQATRACTLIRSKSATFASFFQIVNFMAPLAIHIYCYGHIFIAVRRQNNKMLEHKTKDTAHGSRRRKQEWNLTLLTFCIIVTYVVCFLPYTISILTRLIRTPFHTFAVAFLWMHIVINPLVYLVGDSRLRRTLSEMMNCRKPESQTLAVGASKVETVDAEVQAVVIPLVQTTNTPPQQV